MQCPTPFHKELSRRKSLIAKLFPKSRTRIRRANIPYLTPNQERAMFSLVVFVDGLEIGRTNPLPACAVCWSVMLNAMGYKPGEFARHFPSAAKLAFPSFYKWVDALNDVRAVMKKGKGLERDTKIGREAALETLRQLGIIKPDNNL